MKLVNLEKETRKIKKMILIFLCCLCVAAIESVGKHIPMAFMVSYCLLAGIDEAADKLQEVSFGQITSSEAMWTSSVKLGGAEVQSPKTRDGITTNGSLSMALCLTSFSLYKSGVRSLTTEEARRRAVKMRVVVWYGTRR
ncbi:hypothetical protein Bca101_031600 [Brassica carinata]